MKEILFRARTDLRVYPYSEEWVEGFYIHQTKYYGDPVDKHWIVLPGEFDMDWYDARRIIPETLGQFTGLLDKNGKKIFEGDIIKWETVGDDYMYLVVQFDKGDYIARPCDPRMRYRTIRFGGEQSYCEVIGNIHDNTELLKGE